MANSTFSRKFTLNSSIMNLKVLLFNLLPFFIYSQEDIYSFALVQDVEGFVNVRSDPSIKNNVKDTLATGRVVWCYEKTGDWYYIDYDKKGASNDGYIHRSRLKLINRFEKIPVYKESNDQIVFRKDSLVITLSKKSFVAAENKLQYAMNSGTKYLAKINGKKIWGTDGNVPRTQYKSIEIVWGQRMITVPFTEITDLYEPTLYNTKIVYDRVNDIIYISVLNGDGAGGYVGLFVIKNGSYHSRMITIGT